MKSAAFYAAIWLYKQQSLLVTYHSQSLLEQNEAVRILHFTIGVFADMDQQGTGKNMLTILTQVIVNMSSTGHDP